MSKKKIRTTTPEKLLEFAIESMDRTVDTLDGKSVLDPNFSDWAEEMNLLNAADVGEWISNQHFKDSFFKMVEYLELDCWDFEEGLLLLASLSPTGAIVDFGCENYAGAKLKKVKVNLAQPLDIDKDLYFYPSRTEVFETVQELKEKIKNRKQLKIAANQLESLQKELKFWEKTTNDLEVKGVWRLLAHYESKLSTIYRLWLGTDHPEGKLPKEYFVTWAVERQIELPWLKWAQEHGFFTDISSTPGEYEPGINNKITSTYLADLQSRADHLVTKFPEWKKTQDKVQNTGNLIYWIKEETSSNTREADILKTALAEKFPELKKK